MTKTTIVDLTNIKMTSEADAADPQSMLTIAEVVDYLLQLNQKNFEQYMLDTMQYGHAVMRIEFDETD
jgi:hypothetical protein